MAGVEVEALDADDFPATPIFPVPPAHPVPSVHGPFRRAHLPRRRSSPAPTAGTGIAATSDPAAAQDVPVGWCGREGGWYVVGG